MNPLQLTSNQAARIYAAMCNMNDVGGLVDVCIPAEFTSQVIRVWENDDGTIAVVKGNNLGERYDTRAAFATAYSIVE